MGIECGDFGPPMTEVDLDLAEVLPLFQQMRRITMPQRVGVGGLGDATGPECQPKGPLHGRTAQRFGGRGRALAVGTRGGKQQPRMLVGAPEFAQQEQRALGQRHIAIGIALATADVQQRALGVHVANLQAQGFAQPQPAGVDRRQTHPVIQGRDPREDRPHFAGREHDRQFERGPGADELQFPGPDAAQCFLPKEFEGAKDLGGGLPGDLFDVLEMEAVLAELLGGERVGGLPVVFAELAQTGPISFLGAGLEREEGEVVGKRF